MTHCLPVELWPRGVWGASMPNTGSKTYPCDCQNLQWVFNIAVFVLTLFVCYLNMVQSANPEQEMESINGEGIKSSYTKLSTNWKDTKTSQKTER